MADSKISALTSGNPAQSGDEIPIARGGANYKITAGSIASLSGNGDVVGPASSTDSQIALFNSTTGKLIKAATTTGVLKASSGVIAAATSGTDYVAPAGAFSGLSWQSVQTTGFTAVAFRAYPCNTTSAAFTVTLPASPSAGDQITLTDYAGTFSTNNLTINPNGGKIRGSTDNQVIAVSNNSVQLVYVDSTRGWLAYSAVTATPFLPPPTSIDYLIVAGGGGASTYGGGGAGGFRTGTLSTVSAGTVYTINVGGAGSGATYPSNGTKGGDSYIQGTGITASPVAPGNPYANAITSFGGGFGSGGGAAGSGGSGGGGGSAGPGAGTGGAGNTPSTSPSQGNGGGSAGPGAPNYTGGGGGGAGGSGATGTSTTGGAGGLASTSSISGATVSYSGGGGGGTYGGGTAGLGGGTSTTANKGGGGDGAASPPPPRTAGLPKPAGGGGGGAWVAPSDRAGGNGGSGIVIIAYPTSFAPAAATTGSPTVTTSGGNRIYTFTGNGSITF